MEVKILELDPYQMFTWHNQVYFVVCLVISRDDIITEVVTRCISKPKKGTSTPHSQFYFRDKTTTFNPETIVKLLEG